MFVCLAFSAKTTLPTSGESTSKLFDGISVHVNGCTDPSADVIKRIMLLHGGTYHVYFSTKKTTFIVASKLPYTKIVQLKAKKVVKPEWIVESLRAGRLLPWQNFELYPMTGVGKWLLDCLTGWMGLMSVFFLCFCTSRLSLTSPRWLFFIRIIIYRFSIKGPNSSGLFGHGG